MQTVETQPPQEHEVAPKGHAEPSYDSEAAGAVRPGKLRRFLNCLDKLLDRSDFSSGHCFRD